MDAMVDYPASAARGTHVLRAIVTAARPTLWTKNLVVLAAGLLGGVLLDQGPALRVLTAFVAFCALSGAGCILNDLSDMDRDAHHPVKCARVIANGHLRMRHALLATAMLLAVGLALAEYLSFGFFTVALSYVILQCAYSFALKRLAILDMFAMAGGLVLAAMAGAVAIGRQPGAYLLTEAGLLGLMLAACKRRLDPAVPGMQGGGYEVRLLDQVIAVAAASAVAVYVLYALSGQAVTERLAYTIPFVLFGVVRYLYMVYEERGAGRLEEALLSDGLLRLSILVWAGAAVAVVYG
jgi:4-hydroxybenzoate polyprenyltransferase